MFLSACFNRARGFVNSSARFLCILATGILGFSTGQAQSAHAVGALAELGSGGLNSQRGIAVNPAGDVLVSNGPYLFQLKFNAATGMYAQNSGPTGDFGGFGSNISDVATDSAGNAYIAAGYTVYRATYNAATDTYATAVQIGSYGPNSIRHIAVDAAQNVYFSNDGNAVYKLTAGNGYGYSSVAVTATDPEYLSTDASGALYVTDGSNSTVVRYDGNATQTVATFSSGTQVAGIRVTANALYALTGNGLYRAGGAGFAYGVPAFFAPAVDTPVGSTAQATRLALDANGNIYLGGVAGSGFALKYTRAPKFYSIAAGASATLPVTFVLDGSGTIDAPSNGNVVTGGATGLDFRLGAGSTCTGAVMAGTACTVNIAFAPQTPGFRNGAVSITSGGTVLASTLLGGTATGPQAALYVDSGLPGSSATTAISPQGSLQGPNQSAIDGSGSLFNADYLAQTVQKLTPSGGGYVASTVGSGFVIPFGVATDGAGNVYVADRDGSGGTSGKVYKETVVAGSNPVTYTQSALVLPGVTRPISIAVDANGNLFVGDNATHTVIQEIYSPGTGTYRQGASFSFPAPNTGAAPYGVALDSAGNVYVADFANYAVYKETFATGLYTQTALYSNPGGQPCCFDLKVDGAGNVYTAAPGDGQVMILPASNPGSPVITGTFNQGQYPPAVQGIALDSNGNLFVSDYNNGRMYKIDTADPSNFDFGQVNLGQASGTATTTLLNIGSTDLTLSAPGSLQNGRNPGQASTNFIVYSNSGCNRASNPTVATGSYCQNTLGYAPFTAGTSTSSFIVIDNSNNITNAIQSVRLVGTAPAATGTTANTINFPQPNTPATAGTSTSVYATATAGGQVRFSVISGPATIVATTLTFNGAGTVVVQADSGGDSTYAAAPPVQRTIQVLNNVAAGSISPIRRAAVIMSAGGTLNSITVSSQGNGTTPDFVYLPGDTDTQACAVGQQYNSGETCTVTYRFNPQAVGQRFGGIQLLSTSNATMSTAYISGSGTGPVGVYQQSGSTFQIATDVPTGRGVFVDGAFNVYVASASPNSPVRKYAQNSTTYTTVATPASGGAVVLDGFNNLFYTDYNSGIYEVPAGTTTAVQVNGTITMPDNNLSIDSAGNIYVSDANTGAIYELPAGNYGAAVTLVGGAGHRFQGMTLDANGNLFAVDTNSGRLYEVVAGSGALTLLNSSAQLASASSVAADAAGNLYVANAGGANVLRFTSTDYTAAPTVIAAPATYALTVGARGAIYSLSNTALNRLNRGTGATVNFPDTALGTTSAVKTAAFENDGTPTNDGTLSISSIAPSTNDFTLAAAATSPCGNMLASAAVCNIGVTFTPMAVGPRTANLSVTDNSNNVSNSVQTAVLSGTALQGTPVVTVSNGNIVYGTASTTVSATVTYASGIPPIGAFTFTIGTLAPVTATCTQNPNSTTVETCAASVNTTSLVVGSYTITGNQAADTNYVAASGTGTLIVTQATPAVAVQSYSIVYGTANTTLAVTVTYSGGVAPVGNFNFTIDSAAAVQANCTANNGTRTCIASFPTAQFTVGSHVITGAEATDPNYTAATGTGTLTVTQAAPVVTVLGTTVAYGTASTNLTATIAYSGQIAPAGAFTFTVDTGAAVTANCTAANGTRTCTASYSAGTLTVGSHTISGAEAAGPNYFGASSTGTLTVTQTTPVITVSSATNTYLGTPTALSASIAYSGSGTVPTGSVTFSVDGGTAVIAGCTGSASPLTCTASYPTGSLAAGSHTIAVVLAADNNYAGSTGTGTLTTNMATASITFTIPNHTYLDPPFTVSASSSSSGAFTFSVVSGPATVSGNNVTLTGAGTVTLLASQTATANYSAASQQATFIVGRATPVVTFNMPIQIPYGTPLSTAQLNATATAAGSFAYSPAIGTVLPAGTQTLSVHFTPSDGSDYNVPAASVTSIVIAPAVTLTNLVSSSSPSVVTQSVTFTALVSAANRLVPTGSVVFSDGSAILATVALNGGGSATYTTSMLGQGSHNVTAAYSGDGNDSVSTGSLVQQVGPAGFTLNVTGSYALTIAKGSSRVTTIAVTPTGNFAGIVTLSCANLPSNVTCNFLTPTLTFTGSGGAQSSDLRIDSYLQTGAAKRVVSQTSGQGTGQTGPRVLAAFALPGLLLVGMTGLSRKSAQRRLLLPLVLLMFCLGATAALTGCGSGQTPEAVASPGTYTINVVATSGTTTQTLPLTITVQ